MASCEEDGAESSDECLSKYITRHSSINEDTEKINNYHDDQLIITDTIVKIEMEEYDDDYDRLNMKEQYEDYVPSTSKKSPAQKKSKKKAGTKKRSHSLKKHKEIHNNSLKCNICSQEFDQENKWEYTHHMAFHNVSESQPTEETKTRGRTRRAVNYSEDKAEDVNDVDKDCSDIPDESFNKRRSKRKSTMPKKHILDQHSNESNGKSFNVLTRMDLSLATEKQIMAKLWRGVGIDDLCSEYKLSEDTVNSIKEDLSLKIADGVDGFINQYAEPGDDEDYCVNEMDLDDDKDDQDFQISPKRSKKLRKPQKRKVKRKRNTCDICDITFETAGDLRTHSIQHQLQTRPETFRSDSNPKKKKRKKDASGIINVKQNIGNLISDIKNEMDENNVLDKTVIKERQGFVSREELGYDIQCSIVAKMHKGRPIQDICRLYNITQETVNDIWAEKEKYAVPVKSGRRTAKYMNKILHKKILDWFHDKKEQNIIVSGQQLQDIAEEFAKECGYVEFDGSKKWLDHFKQRYKITLRGPVKRDFIPHTESKLKTKFITDTWSDCRIGFDDVEIYTGDEVGVFFNTTKGRVRKLNGKKFIHGEIKDRLAVFLCSNAIGTDKKRLLVCGSEDPLVNSHRNPDTLPVTYIRHSQGHFTTHIFEHYVKYWNRELQLSNKKALLLLDRAGIHSKIQLSNLKLVFVPWKSSAGAMPMRNGIHSRFKAEFRKLLLEEKALNVVRGIDRNLTCLEALTLIEKAWDRTPPELITNSFINLGYDITNVHDLSAMNMPKVTDEDEEILCQLLEKFDVDVNFTNSNELDNYISVDDDLLTGQGTNGSVFGGNHKVIDYAATEKDKEVLPLATEKPDDNGEAEDAAKKARALEDLEIVRQYLLTNNTTFDMHQAFMDVENFILGNPKIF